MAPVAIVMSDTRTPDLFDWSRSGCRVQHVDYKHMGVATLTYYVNTQYALKHGYEVVYYALQGEGCAHYQCGAGCFHDRWGPRHASYCKVAALGAALVAGYEWVVYIDSDAFLANATLPLPALLRAYGGGNITEADGFFGWDHPYTLGPNMAFIAMRNTPLMRDLVSTWWNLDAGKFAVEHPFEQRTLQWGIMHMPRFRERLVTLNLRTMDPEAREAVVHLDHNAGTKTRLWLMAGAAAEILCAGGKGTRRCPQVVEASLHQLRRPREEVKLGRGRRDRMLDSVVTAVCSDFGRSRRMRLETFNASGFGHNQLRQPRVTAHALRGAPLYLSNCSNDPVRAPWQTWLVGEGSMLRLPWDARLNKPKPCTGLCLLTILSLHAQPDLCLTLGVSRSPRTPYATLAQLELCQPRGLNRQARKAAQQRARLNFNVSTGIIRTSHHLGEFRRLLPEHRLGCGFWSNCSGLRTVLPKPCWSRLADDPEACGESEPTLQVALKRYANETLWPGYKRLVVAPYGPASAAVVANPGKDRLCMQTWRGFFKEWQPVTFVRCPQKGAAKARAHRWKSSAQFQWQMHPVTVGGAASGSKLAASGSTASAPAPAPDEAHTSDAEGQTSPAHGVGRRVRLTPRSAPHLCLTAPALVAFGASSSEIEQGGAIRSLPASLRVDYSTRMRKLELNRLKREQIKARTVAAGGLARKAEERQRRHQELKAKQMEEYKARRRQVEARKMRRSMRRASKQQQ